MLDITRNTAVQMPARFDHLKGLIGRTPMIEITLRYKGEERRIFAKAEHYSLSGSIKDRMALQILRKAYQEGALRPGDTIVEATSGNAGIAFCALGRALGHPVRIYMPDWMSEERRQIMRSYGAEVVDVSKEEGGFVGSIQMTQDLARERNDVFLPRQFDNKQNCRAHAKTTGPEILAQLACMGLRPDAFIAGVGTGGTVMGVGHAMRKMIPDVKIHPLEPSESPTLTTGHKVGHHRIQGVSDEFVPSIVDLAALDDVVCVNDGDAIIMAQKLCRELGLAVGISSGANLIGALKVQDELGSNAVVATILCDDNKKYLSTALSGEEPVKDGYYSPQVELLDFKVQTCPF